MFKIKSKTQNICYIGLGIALYFVLAMALQIPLIGHLKTDLGYIAFGAWCVIFGWQGCIVGAVGCLLESLILSGWFPIGWILGQIAIGLICGTAYKKCNSNVAKKLALEVVAALELAKVTYSEAREVLKMSEKEINYMSAHSLISSGSDNSEE